jgi:hypothetical protein
MDVSKIVTVIKIYRVRDLATDVVSWILFYSPEWGTSNCTVFIPLGTEKNKIKRSSIEPKQILRFFYYFELPSPDKRKWN